jgi:hypothetical protein
MVNCITMQQEKSKSLTKLIKSIFHFFSGLLMSVRLEAIYRPVSPKEPMIEYFFVL